MGAAKSSAAALVGVVKRFGASVALDGVSLGIEQGKVTALLGPNGAGKSTAISLLLGLAVADSGRAELFGQSPQVLAARRRIGVMLQTAALPDTLRVGELVRLTSSYYPSPRPLAEVARLTGIESILRRPYGRLSGGQQRREQFALAICGHPELLFLDEPTTGLDIEARESLWDVVRALTAEGCAVLLTTHYLEEAEALAQRVAVLVRGRIVSEGTVDELRALGVRRHIRCIGGIGADEVRSWPGVVAVTEADADQGADQGADGDVVLAAATGGAGKGVARASERRPRRVGRLDISVTEAEPIVRRLLEADPQLRDLEVTRAGLAEAFVQITQGPMHASDGLAREGQSRTDAERAVPAQEEAA
jgi:ABC-2 type transport system ATP-binding protein